MPHMTHNAKPTNASLAGSAHNRHRVHHVHHFWPSHQTSGFNTSTQPTPRTDYQTLSDRFAQITPQEDREKIEIVVNTVDGSVHNNGEQ